MNEEARSDDMLPEYDLSRGVRQKYAARFANASEDWVLEAAALDRQTWLARSLLEIQSLESYLIAYFALVFGSDPFAAGNAVAGIIERHDERGFESFWTDLLRHTSASEQFHASLVNLLQERNWLVHRSFPALAERASLQDVAALVDRLQSLAEQASRLKDQLFAFLLERCASKGMDEREVREKAGDVIDRWAAGQDAA